MTKSEAGRLGGKIGGRNQPHEVKVRCGKIGGKIVGQQNRELSRGICAPGIASKAGKLGTLAQPWEAKSWGGVVGNHNRWHIARAISKPDKCEPCALEVEKSMGPKRELFNGSPSKPG